VTSNDQAAGRTPPHDLAAEQVTLGAMMESAGTIAEVAQIIKPADHFRPAHQMVHEVILTLWEAGKPTGAVAVADELDKRGELRRVGGAPYLHTLIAAVPVAVSAGYYARIVADEAIKRRLVEAGQRIMQWGYEGDGEAPSLAERARAEIEAVMEPLAGDGAQRAGDLFVQALDALDPEAPQPERVPAPYADLTALTTGFGPGEMIVIAARPAIGKSTAGLDIARHAAIRHGVPSVLFSLEMSRREIMLRMISAEARVPLHAMRDRRLADGDWARIAAVQEKIDAAPLFIDDTGGASLGWFRAQLQALRRTAVPGLMVVDYLQLMTGSGRVENRQVEVAGFSRGLKLLAKEFDLPVIAISQLNRGPEQRTDKRPLMSDLRESGGIENDADVVILLNREDAYEPDSPRAGEADFIVAKHRNGPTAVVTVAFQGHYSRFVDMAPGFDRPLAPHPNSQPAGRGTDSGWTPSGVLGNAR
jgi:replicative DNA helicase